jgi:hypothetical protein
MMTTKCTWRARSNISEVKRAEAPFVFILSSGMVWAKTLNKP